jgi:hypothetical protein
MGLADNPIRAAMKKGRSARGIYEDLKAKAKGNGMTAIEWDWYRARQKEWEPELFEQDRLDARRNNNLAAARELSLEDLEIVLAEKRGMSPN